MPKTIGQPPPTLPPREPLTWGRIFFLTVGIVFVGEFVVEWLLMPMFGVSSDYGWQEIALNAAILSALISLAFTPILMRLEQKIMAAEKQLHYEKSIAQAALHRQQVHEEALNQMAIVAETTPEGVITHANEKFCEISGYTREELIGKTHKLINSGTHPREFWRVFWETIQAGKIWRGEVCNRSKSGALYWVDSTVVPFSDDVGNISKYVSIRILIPGPKQGSGTRRLQLLQCLNEIASAEFPDPAEALAKALDRARAELSCTKGTLGRIDGAHLVLEVESPSPATPGRSFPLAETYAGITLQSREVLAIHRMSQSEHASHACFRRFQYESFLGAPIIVDGYSYGTLEFFFSEARVAPFDEAEIEFVRVLARLLGGIISHRDAMRTLATKNSALDQARKHAEELAEAAHVAARAKADFLANMSHEIRTPLNAIVGMTDLLLDSDLPPRLRQNIDTVRASSDSLLAIVNDILDFSKIESGNLDLEVLPTALPECIEAVLDLCAAKAIEKHLDLLYWIEPDVPHTVLSDRTRLQQILVNLVGNAVKFTSVGEIVVRVSRRSAPGQPDQLHFSVRDTGIGIPEQAMDRLFQTFSQVDNSTTRQFGGTGLGLAISRRLVELLGGRIWVESTVGSGSDFQFTLPLQPAELPAPGRMESSVEELKGLEVLIVDDNATNRWILSEQAKRWGMVPREVSSGREALEAEEADVRMDLVLLDIQMPEMDGYTLAEELLARRPGLGIIILTSLGDQNSPRLAALRINRVLTKPVKAAALREAIFATVGGLSKPAGPIAPSRVVEDPEIAGECPMRILAAEDHPTNVRILRMMLERLGYRAEIVSNGLEILSALRNQDFDLVLLDVQMPEMDGLTAAREICRIRPPGRRPWMLAMTANALEGDREKCLAAGMNDYISKPLKMADLSSAIRRAYQRGHPAPAAFR